MIDKMSESILGPQFPLKLNYGLPQKVNPQKVKTSMKRFFLITKNCHCLSLYCKYGKFQIYGLDMAKTLMLN